MRRQQLKCSMSSFFLLFLILLSCLAATSPVHSPTVVRPYDWVQVGAYAAYEPYFSGFAIIYPNGTKIQLGKVYEGSFKWVIVEKNGSMLRLNVTFFVHARLLGAGSGNITYYKALLVDADLYTRESFIENEAIGKTCFWAEPYREKDESVTLFTSPDVLAGKVMQIRADSFPGFEQAIKYYTVGLIQHDPNARAFGLYFFSYYTSVCLFQTLIPDEWIVPLELYGNFVDRYENGTEYNVTRNAGTKLGKYLGLYGTAEVQMPLAATNIDLALITEPEPQPDDGGDQTYQFDLNRYVPHILAATLIPTAAATLLLWRRKRNKLTKDKARP